MNKLSENITLNEDIFDLTDYNSDLNSLKRGIKITSHTKFQEENTDLTVSQHEEQQQLLVDIYEEANLIVAA